MTLEDFSDIIGVDLVTVRYSCRRPRYGVYLRDTHIAKRKGSAAITIDEGLGDSVYAARSDYVNRIRGKWAIIDAFKSSRREFGVPESLGAGK